MLSNEIPRAEDFGVSQIEKNGSHLQYRKKYPSAYPPHSPSNSMASLVIAFACVYMYVFTHLFLNRACSVQTMLLACVLSGLIVWHCTTNEGGFLGYLWQPLKAD